MGNIQRANIHVIWVLEEEKEKEEETYLKK